MRLMAAMREVETVNKKSRSGGDVSLVKDISPGIP
jgi:hypothetical protein